MAGSGVVFPDLMQSVMPFIQMKRLDDQNALTRERQDRQDAQTAQDRADALQVRKDDLALRIQTQAATMDKQEREKLKDFSEFRSRYGMGVLSMPPEQQADAYEAMRQEAAARKYDMSLFPAGWGPAAAQRLQLEVEQSRPFADYFKDRPTSMGPVGPAPGAPPAAPGAPQAAPGDVLTRSGNAISGIESGGNYGAQGPVTNGDRAYGKYQVMGANIPTWTQEALGKPMTPQEFLASPEAQDAVFKHKFGQYTQKYGPEGAARAWFAGEGGMNYPGAKDVLGTSVDDYARKFNAGMGGGAPAPAPGGQMPASAPPVAPGAPPAAAPAPDDTMTLRSYVHSKIPGASVMGVSGKPVYDAAGRVMIRLPNGQTDTIEAPPKAKDLQEQADKTQKQGVEQANKLRDDFRSEPVVKAYRVVVPMLESAKDAASRPTRAADINLVYAFAKLMDPESVVRESETGMVTATGTVADRIAGLTGQLNGNATLQPETRKRLIAELESRFNSLEASYKEIENAYGEIADSNGVKRSHVILPIRGPKAAPAQGNPSPQEGGGNAPAVRRFNPATGALE